MKNNSQLLNIVSLFSGAGGFDIAACETGRVGNLFSTDSNPIFLDTLIRNLPKHYKDINHSSLVSDVQLISKEIIFSKLDLKKIDLLVGGPPCEDFSSNGRKKGSKGDKAPLIFEYSRLVNELSPSVFLFENVPNIKAICKDFFQIFKDELLIKYNVHQQILSAAEFGSPTIRKRLFLVGYSKKINFVDFEFPKPTHGKLDKQINFFDKIEKKEFVTVGKVFEGLPDVKKDGSSTFHNHTGRSHKPETIDHMSKIKHGTVGNKSYRYKPHMSGLCHSLTAGMDNSTKSYIHPIYPREMSVREYARLHGFADSWIFSGTHHNGIKQVANSVPLPLGKAILKQLIEIL